ncbi:MULTISPECIES: hypothetical protein [unclassified Streptomyces]|uniref:hypothetical protein n=1 Tax=unclassified Streptomyces TaxID=2593676 RepID=UPI002E16621F|nr:MULTISPECIES: hypothetical protein [unclassified Streptomyces]WSR27892.1 hypothetical protein OG573_18145 [Streptomyces sp. NBC_01205]
MADRRLVCLAALALFTGCGGGVAHPPQNGSRDPGGTGATGATGVGAPTSAQGRVLTAADDGFTGRLAVGQTARLRLPLPEGGPEPTARGDSVLLIRIDNVTGTGHREWELRAVRPGTTRISAPRPTGPPATLTLTVP